MKKCLEWVDRLLEWGGIRKKLILLVLGALSLIWSLVHEKTGALPLPVDAAWVAILLCGLPILLEAAIGLLTAFDIKADVLVAMALIASVCIGEYFAAGEVAFIMQLGELLEDATVAKARSGIEKLVRMKPQTARLVSDDTERVIPAEEVRAGDTLRVLPGETIPVDGTILSGETAVNQSAITGESLPVDRTAGDPVFSGTINLFGTFDMRADKVGEDSTMQRLIRLVQSADTGKSKAVGLADRWATWIVLVALSASVLTWIVTGEILRAVTILVVFCPCSLVLATPTAVMAAIGNATKYGLLVRDGGAMDRLAGVNCITFDKTGTLTAGTLGVTAIRTCGNRSAEELYALCASAECRSEHPLGRAIVKAYGKEPIQPEEFKMLPGMGVCVKTGGKSVLIGNAKLFSENGVALPDEQPAADAAANGSVILYIAVDGSYEGYAELADTVRPEAADTVRRIREIGIQPVLLTGDRAATARAVAEELSVDTVCADCLPADKLDYIRRQQTDGKTVCMIGDGVNDAPAMKTADVGIAMGGIGSDIAIEAADIVLVDDALKNLPHLLCLARRMMKIIRINITFSMTLNFIAVFLAMFAVLNPVTGALVHNAGSVLVILNAAMLLLWKQRDAYGNLS